MINLVSKINNDSAVWRGIRTGIQAVVGATVGLLATIWTVPGVPEAVFVYVQDNVVTLAVALGVPAGIAGYFWNLVRRDVPNK